VACEIANFAICDSIEDDDMALMRVRAAAQLTLPADVRKALNIKEGDYLETEIVDGGVLLKPVALVDRKDAWRRIQSITAKVRNLKPRRGEDPAAVEQWIADQVKAHRRKPRRHA
jgi:AbrB family looped-hinge helix DNA binding protein